MEELKIIEEKSKKPAFFYKNAYYLLPDSCETFEQFLNNFCDGKSFKAVRLFERKCQVPYFVIENSEAQEVCITEKVYNAIVYLMTQKEYNAILRKVVTEKCIGCPNFGELTESDSSLIGHHEEISLKKVCYFREMAEKKYLNEYINFDEDNITNFINKIVDNLYQYEKLIDKGKSKIVKEAIEEELWQNFFEFDTTIFVGKKEYSSGYYFYYSSNFDTTKALIMRVVFAKLQEIAKERNWEIKDYIPKGFFSKTAKKPKIINWKEVVFERKYYILQFDEKDAENIDKYLLWFYGGLGEDTLRSFCERIEYIKDLKTNKKAEDFIKEVESYGETLNDGAISFPQVIVSINKHIKNTDEVALCVTLSSDLQDFMDKLEGGENLSIDWLQSLTFGQGALSIYKLEFNLKDKMDFSNLLQSSENKDIDAMIKTTNYFKENLLGTLFTFELTQSKFYIYGIIFNLARFKIAINYLKPLLNEYKTKVTIFTKQNQRDEDFNIDK